MNLSLLRKRDLSLLLLGQIVSFVGTQIQNFALSLYVLKITGSATIFASVLAVALLPQIILGPIAGVLVDWFNRKKIIVYIDIIRGIIIGIYGALFFVKGSLSLLEIYILVITLAVCSILFIPAITTVIPSIVKKEEIVDANSMNISLMNFGRFISPLIAGVLYGVYGLFGVFVVNSISFILSAISEIFINIPLLNKKPDKFSMLNFKSDFGKGINFIINKKLIFTIILMGIIINFSLDPILYMADMYICKKVLYVSDKQYGLLRSIAVIAMTISPIVTGKISRKISLAKILSLDLFLVSLLLIVMAFIISPIYINLFSSILIPYISLIIVYFLVFFIITIGNIALFSMFQREVPISMMGRVGTVMDSGLMMAIPIGQIVFGYLFDKINAWLCLVISAAIILLTILLSKNSLINEVKEEIVDYRDN